MTEDEELWTADAQDADPTLTVNGEDSPTPDQQDTPETQDTSPSPAESSAPPVIEAFKRQLRVLVAPDPEDDTDAPKPQVWLIELDGTPFLRLDIPHPDLEPDTVLIKTYSECEGLYPRLAAVGALPDAIDIRFVGTQECPVIRLDEIPGA